MVQPYIPPNMPQIEAAFDRLAPGAGRMFREMAYALTRGADGTPGDRIGDVNSLASQAGGAATATASDIAGLRDGTVPLTLRASVPLNVRFSDAAVTVVGNLLSAADAGASATISVAAHTLSFDGNNIVYDAGAVTGLPYSTSHYVYVDDPTLSGGSTDYQVTTDKTEIPATSTRRWIGTIVTPASGGPDTDFPGPDIYDRYPLD